MDQRFLELSQYVIKHPILTEKVNYRIKYIDTLEYFVQKYCKEDKWSNSLLTLYKEIIIGETESRYDDEKSLKNISKGVISWKLRKFKFFSYRFCLLTDVLFVCSIFDKQKGKEIYEEIKQIYNKRYWKKLDVLFEAIYENYDQISYFDQLSYIGECIANNMMFLQKRKRNVLITANMSAGKSTLLNAIIGKKVNKTQNDACTAKIHYILNKAFEDELIYELDGELDLSASKQTLMDDSINNSTDSIAVGARFRTCGECDARICFIDTPGVNSSQDIVHKEISEHAIQNNEYEILLYVLNGQNIGTDDDRKHMEYVANHFSGKTIFVVNKLDAFKLKEDSIKDTIESVRKDVAEIGFKNASVYPVSAYAAYLSKMHFLGEELNEDELDELDYFYRKMKKTDFNFEKYYPVELENIEEIITDKDKELMLHSGVLSLEKILM